MPNLIVASVFFLLIHFGVSGTRLRDALSARLGEGPYRGLFALASIAGIAWMIFAYRRAPIVELWGVLLGFRPAAYVLVFIAFLFAVVGILTPSSRTVRRRCGAWSASPGIPSCGALRSGRRSTSS
jgi:uncharacterized membrane protein